MAGLLDEVRWRLIGPFRAGRVVAVAGDPSDRRTFYFGSTGGGVWKTRDGGLSWRNVSDGFFRRASVGALVMAPSDPNVLYAGMGECCIRSNVSHGDGVYRSEDGGATWAHRGLEATRHIGRVRVHPADPDLVYVAALGHAHGPNDERGVYRSRDGGATWELVLHRGSEAGAVDLVLDPYNPRVVYATFWQSRRLPWRLDSGGPGSGLWRSTDGGDTWTDLSRRPGLPKGTLGRIGVAASPARQGRLWAIVESEDGAVFRSDDGGEHWERLSEQPELRHRAWYYQHIFADPRDPDTVWALDMDVWRSVDGGRTFAGVPVPHGDAHDLWFDPADPARLILGSDGGANVSYDGGASWSSCFNQPTAELYHVTTDSREPYRVYAAQQDNTTISLPSHSELGAITQVDLFDVGGGESGYIAVRPDDPDVVYAGNYLGMITRYDHRTRTSRPIHVWPESTIGAGAVEARHRFNWTAPIMLSPHDPNVLYQAGNRVFRSPDGGQSWTPISADLSRADPEKLASSGGLTADNTGAEYYCTVFALAESPLQPGVLWAGTDDGLVHVTRDGGETWTDVTPPGMPDWSLISIVEASPHDPAVAYVAAERHKLDDFRPMLWRTRDFGATWDRLDGTLPRNEFCRVIREDPVRRDLLYCGTETGVHVSFDAGASWRSLRGTLPVVPVHDLVVKGDDLVAATHGRSIWILDDLPAVRQHAAEHDAEGVHLYEPRRTVQLPSRMGFVNAQGSARAFRYIGAVVIPAEARQRPGEEARDTVLVDAGENRASGVTVLYALGDPGEREVRLTFLDAAGEEIRAVKAGPGDEGERKPEPGRPREPRPPRRPGLNRFVWDMRHAPPAPIRVDPPKEEGPWAQAQGPIVPPGRYRVRLEVGDEARTAEFEIVKDPRNRATQEDLEAQYRHAIAVWKRLADVNEAVSAIRELKGQADRWSAAGEEIGDAAASVREALTEIEKDLVQVDPKGSGRLSNPDRLDGKLRILLMHAGFPERPTDASVAVAAELGRQLDGALGRLDAILEGQVEEFNELVRRAAAPALAPRPSAAPAEPAAAAADANDPVVPERKE